LLGKRASCTHLPPIENISWFWSSYK